MTEREAKNVIPTVAVPGLLLLLVAVTGVWAVRRVRSVVVEQRAASERRSAALVQELAQEAARPSPVAPQHTARDAARSSREADSMAAFFAGTRQSGLLAQSSDGPVLEPDAAPAGTRRAEERGTPGVTLAAVALELRQAAEEIERIAASHESAPVKAARTRQRLLQHLEDLPLAHLALLASRGED